MIFPVLPRRCPSASPLDILQALISFRGSSIERFESSFTDYLGEQYKCKTVAAGRQGLFHLLGALELSSGSEVILSSYNFHVIPKVVQDAGLIPVFCEVNENTLNISVEKLKQKITPQTKVIIVTHSFGQAADIQSIVELAHEKNIFVIEDCAHALGATLGPKKLGSYGDASFFSFETVKHINTLGGGMVAIKSSIISEKYDQLAEDFSVQKINIQSIKKGLFFLLEWVISLRLVFSFTVFPLLLILQFLRKNETELIKAYKKLKQSKPRYNKRYTQFQAELGNIQLKRFPLLLGKRQQVGDILKKEIHQHQTHLENSKGAYYFFVVKDLAPEELLRSGIDCGQYPLTDCSPEGLATPLADNILQIPISYRMTLPEAQGLGRYVQNCYNKQNVQTT